MWFRLASPSLEGVGVDGEGGSFNASAAGAGAVLPAANPASLSPLLELGVGDVRKPCTRTFCPRATCLINFCFF